MAPAKLSRDKAVSIIHSNLAVLKQKFNVRSLAFFGSLARDELKSKSDIDVLVEFEGSVQYRIFFNLAEYLENLFHRKVDLVRPAALDPIVMAQVKKDLIYVS
ncbi:MAG: hypothetical protein A2583_10055 [Bdellovibrionales bacterium RIFOXYD1_FULL_53_11]|nr:MAG: hypothetical protein A2583_10055 [Bdellovibrionales bacterium RIFOXYD1_FULL_53_11]